MFSSFYLFFNSKVKTLGAGDSDDDEGSAASWVAKSRKKEKEKILAEKRVSTMYLLLLNPLPLQAEYSCTCTLCSIYLKPGRPPISHPRHLARKGVMMMMMRPPIRQGL